MCEPKAGMGDGVPLKKRVRRSDEGIGVEEEEMESVQPEGAALGESESSHIHQSKASAFQSKCSELFFNFQEGKIALVVNKQKPSKLFQE